MSVALPLDAATSRLLSRPPAISTRITACAGAHRYRVVAYRPLTYEETADAVLLALECGWITQPDDGREAVIYTSIGASRGPIQALETILADTAGQLAISPRLTPCKSTNTEHLPR
jgi:hypothetical protein